MENPSNFNNQTGGRIILSGGFGGMFGVTWTILFSSISVLLLIGKLHSVFFVGGVDDDSFPFLFTTNAILALWPFIRSGNYSMTENILSWKPRFGKEISVELQSIKSDAIRIGTMTSSITLKTDTGSVKLRYISGLERLWGAIFLFSAIPPRSSVDSIRTECFVHKALLVHRFTVQKGFVLIRPGYIAFLPSEKETNILTETISGIASAALNKHLYGKRMHLPFDLYVESLMHRSQSDFDRIIRDISDSCNALLYEPHEVSIEVKRVPFRKNMSVFRIDALNETLNVPSIPQGKILRYHGILSPWYHSRFGNY